MEKHSGRYSLYGNPITRRQSRACDRWQRRFVRMFDYDPQERYELAAVEEPVTSEFFGLKHIVRTDVRNPALPEGPAEPIDPAGGVMISTIRMGFGHYRIAMAGASAARAMGFTPYWLDLLSVPGITTDVISYCNRWYSFFSRVSQRSNLFNKYVWETVSTGDRTLPVLQQLMHAWIVAWPWRFMKNNIKDYKMSELFRNLHEALPPQMPMLTAHMWNCMGAAAGGMSNVVDMMFDNWPMAFQLTEGVKHAVQSPSGYYRFRSLLGFDERDRVLKAMPQEELYCTGHHVDHELVANIEADCGKRLQRMQAKEPRRLLITMGGAGAQRELFQAVIEHCLPLIRKEQVTLFVNLGDHRDNWDWLRGEMKDDIGLLQTHFDWEATRNLADAVRDSPAAGLHVFLFDNTFHAVYATNYLMRVTDVLITKPSELAFYPVPKIFNARVGGHEKWGAVRGAEIGDSTVEVRSLGHTLQAIDLLVQEDDLLELYCRQIVKNKAAGIYDGAYKCVELATGKPFVRSEVEPPS